MAAKIVCLVLFLSLFTVCWCSEILMLMPVGSKSHFTVFEHVANGLAAKDHKITFFSIYSMSKRPTNVKEYHLIKRGPSAIMDKWRKDILGQTSDWQQFLNFKEMFNIACENVFSLPETKALIKEVSAKGPLYDVAIINGFFSECTIPLASIAANHTILIINIPLPHWVAINFNIPSSPSTVPFNFLDFTPPMSFIQRFHNTIGSFMNYLVYKFITVAEMQGIADKHLPEGTITIFEAMKKVSLVLTNSDPIFAVPRPTMPFIVEIGGIHLKEGKPLAKEFKDFIQSSGDEGFLLFGLGSLVEAKYLPKHIRDAFITAFSKLRQKVIWKFEEQIDGLPANVKIVDWMPQQDLLAQPKIRLFIIHAGLLSVQEAAYHGVPLIGIPVFGDQYQNINLAKQYGFAEQLQLTNITADWIHSLIMKILSDKSYYQKAKEASAILKDRLITPTQRAVYWTEYVIRHNGAAHLKNKGAQEQCFVQTLLLDVWAVVILITTAVLAVGLSLILFIAKLITRKFCQNTKQKKH